MHTRAELGIISTHIKSVHEKLAWTAGLKQGGCCRGNCSKLLSFSEGTSIWTKRRKRIESSKRFSHMPIQIKLQKQVNKRCSHIYHCWEKLSRIPVKLIGIHVIWSSPNKLHSSSNWSSEFSSLTNRKLLGLKVSSETMNSGPVLPTSCQSFR